MTRDGLVLHQVPLIVTDTRRIITENNSTEHFETTSSVFKLFVLLLFNTVGENPLGLTGLKVPTNQMLKKDRPSRQERVLRRVVPLRTQEDLR